MRRRTIALILLAAAVVMLLAACGTKLSGTYKAEGLLGETITFDGDEAELSAFGLSISGPYKIEKDEITITYSLLGLSYDWTQSFSRDGKSIFIGGVEFVKQ